MAGANPEALGGLVPLQAGAGGVPLAAGLAVGDVLYWNGVAWVRLGPGLDGFQLTTHDVGLSPTWEAGTVAPVASVFGRVGAVVAVFGDYSFALISGGITDAQHGARAGGALHALVTLVDAGFMSPAMLSALITAVQSTRTLFAGAGLTGGGDLSADRAFDVVANADGSIIVNADDIQVGILATDAQHGIRGGGALHALATALANGFMSAAGFTKLAGIEAGAQVNAVTSVFGRIGAVVALAADYAAFYVPLARNLTAGAGLVGGGDLSADRAFDVVANADGSIIVNANDVQVGILATDAQHGVRGGGGLHALATALLAGFMSAADFTKLAGIPTGGGIAQIFCGGASMGAGDTGKHFGAQDTSNGNKNAVLSSDNQMASGIAGSMQRLSWNSVSADVTTVFKVVKGGLVVETITLTGASGTATLTAAVALGNLIAVEYDSGTAPGRTTVQVYASA